MPRAALYHRVSTVDQNPHAAHDELLSAARQRGHEVTLEVVETGSGANNDRPGLLRVLDAARAGAIDVVICWKLDRFGRSALDVLHNLQQLDAAGVGFTCTTQAIDWRPGGDPMSRMLVTMLAAVAEFERELIRERTRVGMARAKRAGKPIGRPRRPRPEPDDVAQLRAEGLPWGEIALALGCSEHAAQHAHAARTWQWPTVRREPGASPFNTPAKKGGPKSPPAFVWRPRT